MDNTRSVLTQIESSLPQMTKAQRKVSEFILDNAIDAMFLPIEKMALAAGTSTSSIMRLALMLGYTGYSDFLQALQDSVKAQFIPSERLRVNTELFGEDSLFLSFYNRNSQILAETFQQNSPEELAACVDLLSAAPRIFVVGSRASYAMAHYFAYQCYRLHGNCSLFDQADESWPEHLHDLQPGDAVLVYAFPRYPRKVVTISKWAKELGAKIIVIADSPKAPPVQYCDHVLLCATKGLGFQNAIGGISFLTEYLLTAMSFAQKDQVKQRLASMEPLLTDGDTSMYYKKLL